ncbi:MAG: XRE family transcriptional regulator [Candidatus Competibacteraceae bacterium]|nr:MAG: XRE family transcriptional regulator [Candidatus Competibacteraceae bacterium]
MTPTTHSVSASSAPTKPFEQTFCQSSTVVGITNPTSCQVFRFEDYASPSPPVPARHRTIEQLLNEWEQDEEGCAVMAEARHWIADQFYADDGDTVRTLRLRKGWSQSRLAEVLGTSQSHVARIERGTENLSLETCRKLCDALGIDMNALDLALKRQEAIARAKRT